MKTEIKANDLRVGNVLNFGNQFCIVSEIQKECFYAELKDGTVLKNTTCLIENVELTEELLLKKCGFEKITKDGTYFTFNGINLDTDFQPFTINNHSGMWDSCGKPLRYLHKLQNLIYELEDIELTINF